MRSKPARLGRISLDFAEIPPRWDENVSYEQVQVGQSGKVGWNFFQIRFQTGFDEYY